MKTLNFVGSIAVVLFAGVTFSSCDKDDIEINEQNIIGTWVEEYSDYPYYAPDGGLTWTFSTDGYAYIHIYDVFAGDHDVQQTYIVGSMMTTSGEEKDILTLNPHMSDYSGEAFKIVKLTKNEMEWQRLGTTFQKGTVGSDFRHFIRK